MTLVAVTLRPIPILASSSAAQHTLLAQKYSKARSLTIAGKYADGHAAAIDTAADSERAQASSFAAKAWSLAGSCSLIELRLKNASEEYLKALSFAEKSRDASLILTTRINLASLHLQLDDPQSANHYAMAGLSMPTAPGDAWNRAAIELLAARSTARLRPFAEALPYYRSSLRALGEAATPEEFRVATAAWNLFGGDALRAGERNIATSALEHALYLSRMHGGPDEECILRKLANLKQSEGDFRSAAALYQAAEKATGGMSPKWLLYADRGEFRLAQHDAAGALEDFRRARDLVKGLRADVVPNDQGRVNLENGLARIANGYIDAGNLSGHFEETFDAADQSRSLSLAALSRTNDDWRQRLPMDYWDLLSRYRTLANSRTNTAQSEALRLRLDRMEATASGIQPGSIESPLHHLRALSKPGEVFIGFHLGDRQSWVWVVQGSTVSVHALPARQALEPMVQSFREAIRTGVGFDELGRSVYHVLFGDLPARALTAQRWIVALDGPLFDLPLAALVVANKPAGGAEYLCERVALTIAPGALLLRKGRGLSGGSLVGVADSIYNGADPRYLGPQNPGATLPSLPASGKELRAISQEWGSSRSRLLLGRDSNMTNILSTLRKPPAILHFATHIIPGAGEFQSGQIALGLRDTGRMDLLGPADIVARRVEHGTGGVERLPVGAGPLYAGQRFDGFDTGVDRFRCQRGACNQLGCSRWRQPGAHAALLSRSSGKIR